MHDVFTIPGGRSHHSLGSRREPFENIGAALGAAHGRNGFAVGPRENSGYALNLEGADFMNSHNTTPATSPQGRAAGRVKLLIGGRFIESKTTEWGDVVNPATQEVLASVPFATEAEIDA